MNSNNTAATTYLPHADLRRRFHRLSALNIASNLTVPLTGLVDTAMLGRLPDIRFLGGVALASLIFDYLYFSFGFLRMSTTGQTAQAEGAGSESLSVLLRSLAVAAGVAVLILLASPLIERFSFLLLSGEASVEAAGRDYFAARIWGAPAVMLQLALVGWLLGCERSGAVLAVMTVTNLANIVLNWVFIVRLGLAATGAGAASAIAQTLGCGVALVIAWPLAKADLGRVRRVFEPRLLGELLQLNFQILIRTLLLVTCFAVFTDGSARTSSVVLAANSILLRWVSLVSYFVDGLAYAIEALAGRLWGAQDWQQLRQLLRYALGAGVLAAAALCLPLCLWPERLLSLFTVAPEVLATAVNFSPWVLSVGVLGALAYVYDGFFLGLTRGRTLLFAMLLAVVPALSVQLWAVHRSAPHVLWFSLTVLMALRALALAIPARRILALCEPCPKSQ